MEIYGKKIHCKNENNFPAIDMQMSAPLLKFISLVSYLTEELTPNPLKKGKGKCRCIYNNWQPSNSTFSFPYFPISIKYFL